MDPATLFSGWALPVVILANIASLIALIWKMTLRGFLRNRYRRSEDRWQNALHWVFFLTTCWLALAIAGPYLPPEQRTRIELSSLDTFQRAYFGSFFILWCILMISGLSVIKYMFPVWMIPRIFYCRSDNRSENIRLWIFQISFGLAVLLLLAGYFLFPDNLGITP